MSFTPASGNLAIPRTRGLVSGFWIFVLGVWGAVIPFIGPWFHYAFINDKAWHFTYGRLWLDIVPGVVAAVAGLELMRTGNRPTAGLAAWLAVLAGAWFVVGPTVSTLWHHGVSQAGMPTGGKFRRAIEQLGYFYALGALIVFLSSLALGRVSVKSVRDVRVARRRAAEDAAAAGGGAAVGAVAAGEAERHHRNREEFEARPAAQEDAGAGATQPRRRRSGGLLGRFRSGN